MIIAIGSKGNNIDSEVSEVCARAPYFLLFKDNELIEVIKNPFAIGGGGAGPAVVKMLLDKGVEKIICGRFGPNMIEWMKMKNIHFEEKSNIKVKELI